MNTFRHPRTRIRNFAVIVLGGFAWLIAGAAQRAQILVVTHSTALAEALQVEAGAMPRTVVKDADGTWIQGLRMTGAFGDDD